MANYGEMLLSKIVEENRVSALDQYGISRDIFQTDEERKVYDFVRRFSERNGGSAPSYALVVNEVPDFTYIPAVTDSFEYLTRKLKESYGKRMLSEFFADEKGEIAAKFAEIGKTATIDDFVSLLTKRLSDITIRTNVRRTVGIDISQHADKFLAEYRARAAGLSGRVWRSKFPSVNEAIGGYFSSNMYVFYARSGRGKSVITMEEAIEFAWQGATVLVYALEMSWFEWMARAFSSISARVGVGIKAEIDGVDYDAGFDVNALQGARLTPEYEAAFERFVAGLNDIIPGRIILRATNDADFLDRSLDALKADILETGADVVIIDPFYYLDYESNTSKTAGGDAAATSKKLRILTGALDVLTIAITQADEDRTEKDDEGVRELKPPKRAEVKKTKQLLEDGAALIGIDTLAHEGRGVIEISKGRSGGEDTRIEIVYLPNYGIVREPNAEDEAAKFTGVF